MNTLDSKGSFNWGHRIVLLGVLVLLTLQFLLLGKESNSSQVSLRYWLAVLMLLAAYLQVKIHRQNFFNQFSLPFLCLSLFLGWLCLRSWGAFPLSSIQPTLNLGTAQESLLAPKIWFGYAVSFVLFYKVGTKKSYVTGVARWLVTLTFALSLIALPPLLSRGAPIYVVAGQELGFFGPWNYSARFWETFILSRFAHVNIVGDILSSGIFLGLALGIYAFYLQSIASHKRDIFEHEAAFLKGLPFVLLNLSMAGVVFAASLLIHSRGSIVSIVLAGTVFLIAVAAKIRDGRLLMMTGVLCFCLLGVGVWGGNWRSALKEVLTLTKETGAESASSFANKRGAEIAALMYKKNVLWGVGTGRYVKLSTNYDSQWKVGGKLQAFHFTPYSHYLKTLCEEGVGAFFYFAFLLSWAGSVIWGLVRTQSQYKFFMGLAFFCSALTILIHAFFGVLMQYYATSTLLYAYMGLSLACVQKSFRHDQ